MRNIHSYDKRLNKINKLLHMNVFLTRYKNTLNQFVVYCDHTILKVTQKMRTRKIMGTNNSVPHLK